MSTGFAKPSWRLSAAVIFTSFSFFVLETVFFHILEYTTTYLEAVLIISYALFGIGLGGWLASLWKAKIRMSFLIFTVGTWLAIVFFFLLLPTLKSFAFYLCMSAPFLFAGFFLARVFIDYKGGEIYFYDLLGAAIAVCFLFFCYFFFSSEIILLFFTVAMPAVYWTIRPQFSITRHRLIAAILTIVSFGLLIFHIQTGSLDLFHLMERTGSVNPKKIFNQGLFLTKSYDNLIARIDVLQPLRLSSKPAYFVAYNGRSNDLFFPKNTPKSYAKDPRIVAGLIPQPQIFLIGSSAQGVVKTAKYLTPPEKIDGSEINPAIFRIMQQDFRKESNYAYEALNFRRGNALVIFNDLAQKYDIITLMNIHSMTRIAELGPPDFLHTKEFYKVLLQHLTPDGYLMFEERQETPASELGIGRIVSTLYAALKELGVKEPSQNFFIYQYVYGYQHRNKPYKKYGPNTFVGIMVKKNGISSEDSEKIFSWMKHVGLEFNCDSGQNFSKCVTYWQDRFEDGGYQNLFAALAKQDVQTSFPTADLRVLTYDRPFSSQVDRKYPELSAILLKIGGLVFFLALLVFLHSSFRSKNKKLHAALFSYQALVGTAYIIIEFLLIQQSQRVFISPAIAFASVLATLLISSAIGGKVLSNSCYQKTIVACTFLAFLIQYATLSYGIEMIPSYLLKIILLLAAVAFTGFWMGYYFPFGVQKAKMTGLSKNVPVYFAINALGGTVGVPLSFYFSVKYSFSWTFGIAASMYLAAILMVSIIQKNLPHHLTTD